jgi:hypothetical protein
VSFIGEKGNEVEDVFRAKAAQFAVLLNWVCEHLSTKQRKGGKGEKNVN